MHNLQVIPRTERGVETVMVRIQSGMFQRRGRQGSKSKESEKCRQKGRFDLCRNRVKILKIGMRRKPHTYLAK